MLQGFNSDIIRKLILLITLFVITFVGFHLGQNMLQQRQQYLHELLNNENVRLELVHIAQKKALAMNMKFAIMGNSASLEELNFHRTKMLSIRYELEKVIKVIEQGGTVRINNLKNINTGSAYVVTKTYHKYGVDRINTVIFEFKARLAALTDVVHRLRSIVEEKLVLAEEGITQDTLVKIVELENFQKVSNPLFTSILNDSRMLLDQSYLELARIRQIDKDFRYTYKKYELILKITFFTGFLLTAVLVLKSSKKILQQMVHGQLKLDKSERHYRRLIENMSDIISIVDVSGVILYASPSIEKVLGLQSKDILGHNIGELVHPDELGHSMDLSVVYEHQLETDSPLEYHVVGADGDYRTLEVNIQKFQNDDNSDGFIFTGRDISLRKFAEEERYRLQMVIEQAPICVVITDINGVIEYVNPAFEQVSGYSYSDAVGQNPRILKSNETPNEIFTELWQTVTAGKVWSGEIINKKKNGELYTESIIVVPIKGSNGEVTRYAAITEDISELIFEKQRAECANLAKSKFLSQMSHELRTPLNAINGFSQLMLKSKKNPLTEKQQNMTKQINTAGQHLLELINEVLDLARIEAGEVVMSMQPLQLSEPIEDCMALIQSLAEEKNITLKNECSERLPEVVADETKFRQILLNLLSNAVKYNKSDGSVILRTETMDTGFLRFSVIDDGIGIALEKQAELFVPFTRAIENPDSIEGSGIGMTIAKQLVENHGGEIGFSSALNKGSTFWFTLPFLDKNG